MSNNMREEIKALLSSSKAEAPLSEAELAKLTEKCSAAGLPIRAFQFTPSKARAFIAEGFGSGEDEPEKDTKKNPDGDKGEKLLDKDKKTEGEVPDNFKKKGDGDDDEDDEDDEDDKDDEVEEDTTSANIATVPLPMGNFKKKDVESADAARIARIKARHRMAKMSESRRKPIAEMIVDALLEDEK